MSRSLRITAAFTLLELLVAVSVTAALAAIMLTVATGTLSLWSHAQDRFTTDTQANVVLDYLERDLGAAVFRADGAAWLAVDFINNPATLSNHGWVTVGVLKPSGSESTKYVADVIEGMTPSISRARFGLSGAWLRFITTNIESGASLPVAVSYQIARRPISGAVTSSNAAAVRYSLFRAAVSSSTTFAVGYNVLSGYGSSSATPPAQRSAGTVANPNTSGDVIATNVVDFGLWLYTRNSSGGLQRIFPSDASDSSHTATATAEFPVVADVMLRILTNEGARLIEAIEAANGTLVRPAAFASDAEWWWGTVEANSVVYLRRIQVGAGLP